MRKTPLDIRNHPHPGSLREGEGVSHRRALKCFGIVALIASLGAAPATRYVDNTDESKSGTYTLPDALTLNNGQPVRDAQTWTTQRRPQLLDLFRTQVYGIAPPRPSNQTFVDTERAIIGDTYRRQVQIRIDPVNDAPNQSGPHHPIRINVLMYGSATMNALQPVLLCFSFTPLHTVTHDPAVALMEGWNSQTNQPLAAKESSRGMSARGWPIEKIVARGYTIAIVYYQQIEPDAAGEHDFGVRWAYAAPGERPGNDSWGTIAAWAWGASRVMDFLRTQPDLDKNRIAIVGHSRLGKTALWTGASDDRFSMVIAAQSGRGGAALARRHYGEDIQRLTSRYGYQFCQNYVNWASHINDMPVDSHELIDLIAPRPFYQTASVDDKHSDPLGEFLAEVAAAPVYQLLGADPLDIDQMPPLNQPIMHTLGFHYRPGRHEVSAWDWDRFLDFADLQFRHIRPTTRLAN